MQLLEYAQDPAVHGPSPPFPHFMHLHVGALVARALLALALLALHRLLRLHLMRLLLALAFRHRGLRLHPCAEINSSSQ